ELLRLGRLQLVPALRVDGLRAGRTAAEQPDGTSREAIAMAPDERGRRTEPAAHVGRAPDDESVIFVDRAGVLDAPQRDVQAGPLERRGDALGDAPGGAVAGGVGNEDLHGVLLPAP